MKYRLLILLLFLTLGTSVLFAESGTCGDNLTWTYENGVLTISGEREMEDYYHDGDKVAPWQSLRLSNIKKVIISNGVTSIGDFAFCYCTGLTSVSISNSVTHIGKYAFYYCNSLISINIPSSVTSIEMGTFMSCWRLTSINIPNSVTNIRSFALSSCISLTSVNIPNSVTSIGDGAFNGCKNLQEIHYPEGLDLSKAGIPSSTKLIPYPAQRPNK